MHITAMRQGHARRRRDRRRLVRDRRRRGARPAPAGQGRRRRLLLRRRRRRTRASSTRPATWPPCSPRRSSSSARTTSGRSRRPSGRRRHGRRTSPIRAAGLRLPGRGRRRQRRRSPCATSTERGGRPRPRRRRPDADRGEELPHHAALGGDADRPPAARGARRLARARPDPAASRATSSSGGRRRRRASRRSRQQARARGRGGGRVRARLAAPGARRRPSRTSTRRPTGHAGAGCRDERGRDARADDVGGAERGAARGDGARPGRLRDRRGHRARSAGSSRSPPGCSSEFGPQRVIDAPISEAAQAGAGVGAALVGCRPVVELQIADFVTLTMDQVVNHAAKWRYMSGGQVTVPFVLRGAVSSGIGMAGAALADARGVVRARARARRDHALDAVRREGPAEGGDPRRQPGRLPREAPALQPPRAGAGGRLHGADRRRRRQARRHRRHRRRRYAQGVHLALQAGTAARRARASSSRSSTCAR